MSTLALSWRRSELVSAAFCVCFLNGLAGKMFLAVQTTGWNASMLSLFGVSAFVYICAWLALGSILESDDAAPSRHDIMFLGAVVAANAIPSSAVSWLAMTALGGREYFLFRHMRLSRERRAAVLIMGVAVAMLWGRLLFSACSSLFLQIDAMMVAAMTGSARVGNVIEFSNQGGFMWIADPCSSFQNISLAMLCWLMFTEFSDRPRTVNDYFVCFFACLNVVIINVTRISIMAMRPDLYEVVHGPYGAIAVGYLSTIVVLLLCASGIKRERVQVA